MYESLIQLKSFYIHASMAFAFLANIFLKEYAERTSKYFGPACAVGSFLVAINISPVLTGGAIFFGYTIFFKKLFQIGSSPFTFKFFPYYLLIPTFLLLMFGSENVSGFFGPIEITLTQWKMLWAAIACAHTMLFYANNKVRAPSPPSMV